MVGFFDNARASRRTGKRVSFGIVHIILYGLNSVGVQKADNSYFGYVIEFRYPVEAFLLAK